MGVTENAAAFVAGQTVGLSLFVPSTGSRVCGRGARTATQLGRYQLAVRRQGGGMAGAAQKHQHELQRGLVMKTKVYKDRSGPKLRDLINAQDATVYDLDSNALDLVSHVKSSSQKDASGAVIVWMRHYGCVLCKKLLASVQDQLEAEAAKLGYTLVAIGPGKPEQAAQFKEKVQWKHDVLSDPLRTTYRALSFKKGILNTFNLGGLKSMVGSFAEGFTQDWTVIPSDPFALGGLLIVDADGVVVLNHVDDFAGDHPNMKMISEAMREFASPNLVK